MTAFIIGVALLFVMGITLGLLGGGGSILAVPILAYVVGLPPKESIALSLLIVGTTAFGGAFQHYRKGSVEVKIGLIFGVFAMVGSYLGGFAAKFVSGTLLLVLFALMMFAASIAMLRNKKGQKPNLSSAVTKPQSALANVVTAKASSSPKILFIALEGFGVGGFTGLVGAGGGFLVVPALVLLGGLPMHKAVGTSLLVIGMKSASAFVGYLQHTEIHWMLALFGTIAAVGGSFVGSIFSHKIPQQTLRKVFGWFILVMGIVILIKEGWKYF